MLLFASVHNYPEALKRLLVKIRIIRKSERLEAIEMFHSVFFNLILFCFTFFFFLLREGFWQDAEFFFMKLRLFPQHLIQETWKANGKSDYGFCQSLF